MISLNRYLQALLCALLLAAPAAPAGDGATARDAWARATPPGMSVGAVYLTLQGGTQADRLVAASTPRAQMTEIHVASTAAGMARMRPTDGVDVPAHATVQLAPQGTHVMLMGLDQPLVAGERFPLTLRYATGAVETVQVAVRAPGDDPPASH